jgi:hypothetical protein
MGVGAMTIDELRAFCMSLPGTHEKETWGDAEHAGDVTFRVKDKIYLITGQDGGATIRTTIDQQADLIAAFPSRFVAHVGRFGWVTSTSVVEVVRGHRRRRRTVEGSAEARPSRLVSRSRRRSTPATRPARASCRGVRPGARRGRSALIPYVVAGYPDAARASRSPPRPRRQPTCSVGLPYSDPSRMAPRSSGRPRRSPRRPSPVARARRRSRSPPGRPDCRWATRTS